MSSTGPRVVLEREVARLLHPRPAYLITSCDTGGRLNVSTVAWVSPLSHDPPLLGLSIRPRSRTHACIVETRQFVVNVVGEALQSVVRACGTASGWDVDKIAVCGLSTLSSSHVAPARLADALAWLECSVVECHRAGDHVLFIAHVVLAEVRDARPEGPERGDVLLCADRDRFGHFTSADRVDVFAHQGIRSTT